MELLIDQYLAKFIAVLGITVLTIITLGPDFFIVFRNSPTFSKRSGIFTTLGAATAVWIHITYTLAGIGIILAYEVSE